MAVYTFLIHCCYTGSCRKEFPQHHSSSTSGQSQDSNSPRCRKAAWGLQGVNRDSPTSPGLYPTPPHAQAAGGQSTCSGSASSTVSSQFVQRQRHIYPRQRESVSFSLVNKFVETLSCPGRAQCLNPGRRPGTCRVSLPAGHRHYSATLSSLTTDRIQGDLRGSMPAP